MNTILVVDDEPQIRLLYAEFLRLLGYRVCSARNGREALALAEQESLQMIVLDVDLPDMSGVDVLGRLCRGTFAGKVLLLAGARDEAMLGRVRELGEADVMGKPFGLEDLARVVCSGLAPGGEERHCAGGSKGGMNGERDERCVGEGQGVKRRATFGGVFALAEDLIHGRVP